MCLFIVYSLPFKKILNKGQFFLIKKYLRALSKIKIFIFNLYYTTSAILIEQKNL